MTSPSPTTTQLRPSPAVERPRGGRAQAVLTVQRTEQIGPHLVRVVLGGDGFADVRDNAFTDKYVKIMFTDPALGLTPPYDLEALREQLAPDQLPVRRTYTVRRLDPDVQELTIDFVTHGDEGVAGPWARAAQPGDLIALSGAGGAYSPDPTAEWHLFVGDDTAVPAISSAVEALAADAVGVVLLEVDGPADEVPVATPAGVSLRWLHRAGATPGATSLLPAAVQELDWPTGRVQVFAHGERGAMKALRAVFADRAVPRADLSLSGYWAFGRSEDRFQAEKREPIGQIFPD